MKKLLTTLFILLSLIMLSNNFAGGSGTIEDPYLISTAEQLDNVRNHMDKHFLQIKDIDLSVYDKWEPLGIAYDINNEDNIVFTGSYNGNNYIIDNLTISKPEETFVGLFRYLDNNAVIKNVELNNVNIHGYNRVGAIAGYVRNGIIKNSKVKGKIKGVVRVGAITGSFSNEAELHNSSAKFEVYGRNLVGGLVGVNLGKIINSSSIGKIDFKEYPLKSNEINISIIDGIGGITGANLGKIINCKYNGDINGYNFVGGIAGQNNKLIKDSYSSGNIKGVQEVGGITGINRDYITGIKDIGKIKNSNSESNVYGEAGIGGITGINKGNIYDSNFTGTTTGKYYTGNYIGANAYNGIIKYNNEKMELKENDIGKDFRYKEKPLTLKEKIKKYSKLWGIEGKVIKHVNNDIEIDWYENQYETGEYGYINCGPTSAAMAINWHNKEIVTSGEELSKLYLEKFDIDNGWKINVLIDYFNYKNIPFDIYFEKENIKEKIIEELNKGNILIVAGNMENISSNLRNIEKTGFHYNTSIFQLLHTFIIKGYVETDKNNYFEIYDPYSDQYTYLDGNPIGKNSYYSSNDIEKFLINNSIGKTFPILIIRPKSFEKTSIEKTENFAGGSGTIEDPYLISTAEQLDNIRNHMDKHFLQINDIDLSVYDNWEPIGSFNLPFAYGRGFYGSYDGNGYTITNLTIDRPNEDSIGLFSFIQTKNIQGKTTMGKVKNITIESANVIGNDAVGILVGVNNGKITECKVEGKIKGNAFLGGTTGINIKLHDKGSKIKNTEAIIEINGKYLIGGLVGNNQGVVESSITRGKVNGQEAVGGSAGHNEGYIKNSYSKTNINGKNLVGGFVGLNKGFINICFSLGNVNGEMFVGGFTANNTGEIKNVYTIGNVSGSKYVGAIIGANMEKAVIENAYSVGNVSEKTRVVGLKSYNEAEIRNSFFSYGAYFNENIKDLKTIEEMKKSKTYRRWDFENIWGIEEGVTTPYLQWEYEILNDIKKLDKQKYNILLMHLNQKELINDYFHKNNFQDRFNQIKWIIYLIIIMIVISILLILFLKSNKSKNIFKPIIVLITIIIIFISFTLLRNYQNELDGLFLQINSLRNNLELSDIESIENIPILVEKEIAKYIGNTNTIILKHTNYISLLILISGYTALSLFLIKIKKILGLIKKIKLSILILIKLIKNKI